MAWQFGHLPNHTVNERLDHTVTKLNVSSPTLDLSGSRGGPDILSGSGRI